MGKKKGRSHRVLKHARHCGESKCLAVSNFKVLSTHSTPPEAFPVLVDLSFDSCRPPQATASRSRCAIESLVSDMEPALPQAALEPLENPEAAKTLAVFPLQNEKSKGAAVT